MSLRIWLPLTKDLRQQGLDNWIFNSYGTITQPSTGKLGNCLKTEATGTIYNNNISLTLKGNFSIGYWLRIDASQASYNNFFSLDYDGNHYCGMCYNNVANSGTIGWHVRVDINGTATNIFDRYAFTGLTTGQWYHIGLTMENGTTCKMYLNGVLIYTGNTSTTYPTTTYTRLTLGSKNYNNLYSNCSINDFRVYDHTLSQMEVKELAKGLVLHYPLNRQGWGQINNIAATKVVNRSCNNFTYNSSTHEWSMSCPTGSGTWGYGIAISDTAIKWATSQTWVISMEVYVPRSIAWNCDINNKPDLADVSEYTGNDYDITGQRLVCTNGVMGNKTLQTGWNKIWFSQTAGTTYGLYNYSTNWGVVTTNESAAIDIKIKNVKGEIINAGLPIQPTPWCPNSADELATTMGLNSTTEYDCSGFGNNGVRTGTFSWTSDTPKYMVSQIFNGTDNVITLPSISNILQNPFTMNIWFSKNELGSKNYETLFGGPSGFEMDTRAGSASTLTLYMASTRGGSVYTGFQFGEWYMITLVNDGTNELYYVNGGLVNTIEKKAMPTGTYFIGAWNSATSQNYKGQMCDARIYATALSADDVKSLYQNSAYIDSSGNVYGAVHSEV